MNNWNLEIELSPSLTRAIANSQDKRRVGMAIARAMDRQNEKSVNEIQRKLSGSLLRVRSGRLRESIQRTDALVLDAEVRSSVGSNVRSGGDSVKYAAPLEFGSRPHVIAAKNKKALRFVVGGSVLLRRRVNHPGNKPYSFLRGTIAEREGNYRQAIGDAAMKVIGGAQ